MRHPSAPPGPWRARLGAISLVLFVAVDVALVGAAVRHSSAPPDPADTPAGATRSPEGLASPSGAATPDDRTLLVALAEDGTLVAADPGSCTGDGAAQVRVSTDGGASFQPVDTPDGLTAVLSVRAGSADDLGFVGTADSCAARAWSGSATAGTWDRAPGGDDTWHLVAENAGTGHLSGRQEVHSPHGPVPVPCAPTALSSTASVRVLCDDTRILGTPDSGRTWVVLGRLPRASLVAFADPGTGYAVAARPHCRHAVMSTHDGGASWSQGRCLGPRPVHALVARGDAVVAVVGDRVEHSDDGGTTWWTAG